VLQAAINKLTPRRKPGQENRQHGDQDRPVYSARFEQPKGKIDAIDPESRFAYLNVGAAEGVKRLLTFQRLQSQPRGKVDLLRARRQSSRRDRNGPL